MGVAGDVRAWPARMLVDGAPAASARSRKRRRAASRCFVDRFTRPSLRVTDDLETRDEQRRAAAARGIRAVPDYPNGPP